MYEQVVKFMVFKPSKLTPGHNLLWESSRMMLPEVDMLQRMKREQQKKKKPEFDEQYLSELAMKIAEAMQEGFKVCVHVFDEYKDIEIIGKITHIDRQLRRLKIEIDEYDIEWVNFDDILDVEKV